MNLRNSESDNIFNGQDNIENIKCNQFYSFEVFVRRIQESIQHLLIIIYKIYIYIEVNSLFIAFKVEIN